MIQDTSFIIADPGYAKMDEPRGDEAKTRRTKDRTMATLEHQSTALWIKQ